jgi:hypothetical protein
LPSFVGRCGKKKNLLQGKTETINEEQNNKQHNQAMFCPVCLRLWHILHRDWSLLQRNIAQRLIIAHVAPGEVVAVVARKIVRVETGISAIRPERMNVRHLSEKENKDTVNGSVKKKKELHEKEKK